MTAVAPACRDTYCPLSVPCLIPSSQHCDVANMTVPTSQRGIPKQNNSMVNMPRVTQLVAEVPEPLISVTAV